MSTEPDDFADLDPDDVEQLACLSDEELADALECLHERNPLAGYCTPVTRRRKPNAVGRRIADVRYRPARNPQPVRSAVDNPTDPHETRPVSYGTALDVLLAHPNEADALAAALDAIRAWRHLLPHSAAVDLAPLDAVLDAAALGSDVLPHSTEPPTSVQAAVEAHRDLMAARARAFEAHRLVWDRIEAASIRAIARTPKQVSAPRPDECGPECSEQHTYAYRCALKPPPIDPQQILGVAAEPETPRQDGT
ncbi:hypothetical protein ACWC4J_06690 [Streptomyces sp. NPDC001356]